MLSYSHGRSCSSEIATARVLLGAGLICLSTLATAKPDNITSEEMAMLPRYCPYTESFGNSGFRGAPSPGARPWVAIMGDGFWAVHHYCWAQINLQRALRNRTPAQTRQHLLETVVADYGYVIANTKKDFILLPEIFTRMGEAYLLLSRFNDANVAFAKARALKPDYWPAYSQWADFLIGHGKKPEAKLVVKAGLEYSPNSKVLQEQYRLLGGKPSEIVPRVKDLPPENKADDSAARPLADEAPAGDTGAERPAGTASSPESPAQ